MVERRRKRIDSDLKLWDGDKVQHEVARFQGFLKEGERTYAGQDRQVDRESCRQAQWKVPPTIRREARRGGWNGRENLYVYESVCARTFERNDPRREWELRAGRGVI
jgi:hypothetical protein